MDDKEFFILDLAAGFKKQHETIQNYPQHYDAYLAQLRDDVIVTAMVIFRHYPKTDMALFYQAAGYEGIPPTHIQGEE